MAAPRQGTAQPPPPPSVQRGNAASPRAAAAVAAAPAAVASMLASAPQRKDDAAPVGAHEPSIAVFRAHLARTRLPDGSEQIDGDGVISAACYENWLRTRGPAGVDSDKPERVFQRTLTSCLTAADGRRPFDPDEEAAILKTIRVKRIWYVFP